MTLLLIVAIGVLLILSAFFLGWASNALAGLLLVGSDLGPGRVNTNSCF